MTKYAVQYELPDSVNNPGNKVSKNSVQSARYRGPVFYVPITHPKAHTMGFAELVEEAELSGLIRTVDKP